MSSEATYFPKVLLKIPSADASDSQAPPAGQAEQVSLAMQDVGTLKTAETSDSKLMEQVQLASSKDALALLFRRHAHTVRNVAWRILRDESEADDLVQDVFLFVFQRAALFDADKGTPISWIIQITYHRAINRRRYLTVRHHYSAQELNDEQMVGVQQNPSIDGIAAKRLLSQLEVQLSVEQRRTLELHYFEGYSLREIAEKTGETLGNTRHHFYRALERLRANVFPEKGV